MASSAAAPLPVNDPKTIELLIENCEGLSGPQLANLSRLGGVLGFCVSLICSSSPGVLIAGTVIGAVVAPIFAMYTAGSSRELAIALKSPQFNQFLEKGKIRIGSDNLEAVYKRYLQGNDLRRNA